MLGPVCVPRLIYTRKSPTCTRFSDAHFQMEIVVRNLEDFANVFASGRSQNRFENHDCNTA